METPIDKKTQTRGLIVVTIAIFTDMLVYGLVVPILPSYATLFNISQTSVGLLYASYAIALFFATPFFGVLSDKIGRKGPLLWGLIGLGGSTLFFAFANSYKMLLIARSLQGIAAAITWTAGLALLADLYPSEERGRVMGLALSGMSLGTLLGPTIGGWLFQIGGYQLPFLIAAGIVLFDGILRIVLIKDVPHQKTESIFASLKIVKNPQILVMSSIIILGATIPCILESTYPLFLDSKLHFSPLTIGLLFAIPTLCYGITAPFIGKFSSRIGNFKVMIFGLILSSAFFPLLVYPTSLWFIMPLMALIGIGMGLTLTPSLPEFANISQKSGTNSYGVVYSIYNMAYSVGMMLGPIIASVFTDLIGIKITYFALSFAIIIYSLLLLFQHKNP